MPCWTIKKTTVSVAKMNPEILADGLRAAGFSVKLERGSVLFARSGEYRYHSYSEGVLHLTGSEYEALTNEVKRAYSAQAVRHAATQFGWKLSENKPQQFAAMKRR